MNKEATVKYVIKTPLITANDIRILDSNFGSIVNEVLKAQCKEKELALLQLIIKKQQQALLDIKEYMLSHLELGQAEDLDYLIIRRNVLQIIDKVLGSDKNE